MSNFEELSILIGINIMDRVHYNILIKQKKKFKAFLCHPIIYLKNKGEKD